MDKQESGWFGLSSLLNSLGSSKSFLTSNSLTENFVKFLENESLPEMEEPENESFGSSIKS